MFRQPNPPGQPPSLRAIAERSNDPSHMSEGAAYQPPPLAKDNVDSASLGVAQRPTAADPQPFKGLRGGPGVSR